MYEQFFKRILDFLIALIALLLLSPVILVVFVALLISYRSTPFFFQDRPGFQERKIQIIKFKSLNDKRDASGNVLPDNVRLTPLGKFIRKYSLDELPQLINVLIGDMSLVGPRPLLFKYLPLYNNTQRRRHEARPGITGWAQVNGRNSISWEEKFKLDVYYVDHVSLAFDLKILWLTVMKVIQREGVNQSDDRPMQPFTGNS